MSIYAIADLHLSFQENKPMSIFGENWEKHEEKIKKDWEEKVKKEDIVLMPGDFSWAMDLKNTYEDFKYLNNLPGKKIMLKGNHDYWWTTQTKMKKYLQENNFQNIEFLYNNSYECENKIIVGTRGWIISDEEENKKIIRRELIRLELSIKDGIQKYGKEKEIILCMHYPPITMHQVQNNQTTEFIEIIIYIEIFIFSCKLSVRQIQILFFHELPLIHQLLNNLHKIFQINEILIPVKTYCHFHLPILSQCNDKSLV